MKIKNIAICLIIFSAGALVGGYLFRNTQPRSFLTIDKCSRTCLKPNELLGLLGSAGVQKLPDFVPFVVKETDKTVVIESPVRQAPIHYIIFPKKDIRDAGDISKSDREYLVNAYAVMTQIIKEKNLRKYKIYTNGPDYQAFNYLHFHLLSGVPNK